MILIRFNQSVKMILNVLMQYAIKGDIFWILKTYIMGKNIKFSRHLAHFLEQLNN